MDFLSPGRGFQCQCCLFDAGDTKLPEGSSERFPAFKGRVKFNGDLGYGKLVRYIRVCRCL